MAVAKRWIGSAVLALAVIGLAQPAGAVSLWSSGVGGTVSVDGLTITVTSCTLKLSGVSQTDCSFANAELITVATTTGAKIEIDHLGGGNLFSVAVGSGLTDLKVTLNVSAAVAKTTVNFIGATLTGSVLGTNATTTEASRVSLGESYTGLTGASAFTLNLSTLGPPYSGTVSGNSGTFTAIHPQTNSFNVTKDLKLNAGQAPNGDTLVLANVTQLFLPAPEPLSSGALVVGLGGLAMARRRRNR